MLCTNLGGQPLNGHATNDGPHQGAQAAHDHPHNDLCRLSQAENGGAGERAPIGEKTSCQTGNATTQCESKQFESTCIEAEQGSPLLVFFNSHDHMPYSRGNQPTQAAVDSDQGKCTEVEEGQRVEYVLRVARVVDGGYGRYAVKATQGCIAYAPLGACGGIDRTEKNQTHRQCDDTHIDIRQATIKHEIAQQQSKQPGQGDGQKHRHCAFAHIDH